MHFIFSCFSNYYEAIWSLESKVNVTFISLWYKHLQNIENIIWYEMTKYSIWYFSMQIHVQHESNSWLLYNRTSLVHLPLTTIIVIWFLKKTQNNQGFRFQYTDKS